MKKRWIAYGIIFLVLQFIKGFLMEDYRLDLGDSRLEILIQENQKVEYRKLKNSKSYGLYNLIVLNQKKQSIEGIDQSVRTIGTTSTYKQLEHLPMVSGAFFTNKAVQEERNVAVISDELSRRLFGSSMGKGNRLRLNEEVYEVVGVYKKYRRLRDYIVDDGYERIYIPITCAAIKDEPIRQIIIDDFSGNIPNERDLNQMGISSKLNINSDQSRWLKKSQNIIELPIWILHLVMIAGFVRYLYQSIRYSLYMKREKQEKHLFLDLKCVGIGATFILYIGIVVRMSLSKIYIPSEWLPQDNLFDVVFYWKKIQHEWAISNLFLIEGISKFKQTVSLLNRIMYIINMIQIVVMIKFIRDLKIKYKINETIT